MDARGRVALAWETIQYIYNMMHVAGGYKWDTICESMALLGYYTM